MSTFNPLYKYYIVILLGFIIYIVVFFFLLDLPPTFYDYFSGPLVIFGIFASLFIGFLVTIFGPSEEYDQKSMLVLDGEVTQMWICPNCGAEITAIGEYCPSCGEKIK